MKYSTFDQSCFRKIQVQARIQEFSSEGVQLSKKFDKQIKKRGEGEKTEGLVVLSFFRSIG